MIQVSDNFGKKEPCPICQIGNNDQQHLLECDMLKSRVPEAMNDQVEYDDLYDENAMEVIKISKLLHTSYLKREVIMEERSI